MLLLSFAMYNTPMMYFVMCLQAMNKELNRLASYESWPSQSAAWPSRLARYGFYATGDGDTVMCFSCSLLVSQWLPGVDPKEKHHSDAPDCLLVSGQSTTNVPMMPLCDDFDQNLNADSECHRQGAARSRHRDGDVKDSCFVSPPVTLTGIYAIGRAALDRANRKGVLDENQPAPAVDPENPDFELLRREAVRLATFADFPPNSPVTSHQLAEAGFFYKGPRDRVQCAFCRGLLKNWVIGDDAMAEHRRHMPDCPFVTDAAHAGNIRIADDNMARERTETDFLPSAALDIQVSICLFASVYCSSS